MRPRFGQTDPFETLATQMDIVRSTRLNGPVRGSIEAGRLIRTVYFLLEEAYGAREAFLTSAINLVMPVAAIDERLIGDGRPGPIALSLRGKFHAFAETSNP